MPPIRLVAVASQLLKSTRKLNTGRTPGPTGITMQHLVFLLSNETTAPLVANLICLINRGLLTGEGKTMLLASRLLAIKNCYVSRHQERIQHEISRENGVIPFQDTLYAPNLEPIPLGLL
jgi:hypothetical protein